MGALVGNVSFGYRRVPGFAARRARPYDDTAGDDARDDIEISDAPRIKRAQGSLATFGRETGADGAVRPPYTPRDVDGVLGPRTRTMLRAWQATHVHEGMEPRGRLTNDVYEQLIEEYPSAEPTPGPPATPPRPGRVSDPGVLQAQKDLTTIGVTSPRDWTAARDHDGVFGPRTREATRTFQVKWNSSLPVTRALPLDGELTPDTRAALAWSARSVPPPWPTDVTPPPLPPKDPSDPIGWGDIFKRWPKTPPALPPGIPPALPPPPPPPGPTAKDEPPPGAEDWFKKSTDVIFGKKKADEPAPPIVGPGGETPEKKAGMDTASVLVLGGLAAFLVWQMQK